MATTTTTTPCALQTSKFFELPPEIRNLIYELALPSKERNERLFITSPYVDNHMTLAVQPAVTRVSRQTRSECLAMFYANNEFSAYINRFEIRELLHFVRCITSGPTPRPQIRIHTFMMHNMGCYRGLLDMANDCHLVKEAVISAEMFPPKQGKADPRIEKRLRSEILRRRAPSEPTRVACAGPCECSPLTANTL
ncbi:hypothetical protein CKM354_000713400 [Cercospora kikuchii]|uniref:2EXR domain-containing protein n=1 Tax=Cercospora kikuchii TaxID=84275 RepID=A0A9P3CNX0_9PEZI|nr:uncharacterized protein CKM354_000713400 [Cercospora kikuchii]GIZ43925.1 hypothetical protein CKM354_000713400 [Cercospora kikuchii]